MFECCFGSMLELEVNSRTWGNVYVQTLSGSKLSTSSPQIRARVAINNATRNIRTSCGGTSLQMDDPEYVPRYAIEFDSLPIEKLLLLL